MDEETGLYYYGARYLDQKYSRWLSGDPALSDYIPKAPIDDEAKKHNENLPGMGGVFNVVNLHLYHYAGNNPVKYTDPDGKIILIPDILQAIKNLTSIQKSTREAAMYQYEAGGNYNLPGSGKSWCNQSSFDVMIATGFNTNGVFEVKGRYNTSANQAATNLANLANDSKNSGIYEVSPAIAQTLANLGVTVVGAWNGGSQKGHLATVVPESSTTLKYSDTNGPILSNIGGSVGVMSTKDGFWRADKTGGWKTKVKFYIDSNQFVKFDTTNVLKEFQ